VDRHLYGGAGEDILVGGTGIDMLEGGAGNDTYIYNAGDGNDIIEDADGTIIYNGAALTGGTLVSENVYESSDGAVTYLWYQGLGLNGMDLLIIHGSAGTLRVNDFQNNELGISLDSTPPVDETNYTPVNLTENDDFILDNAGPDEIFALGGNDQIFISSSANDVVHGGEGDDLVFSVDQEGASSDDRLYGDAGRDGLSAGSGNDKLYGGSEDDLLTGGEGDDYLEGNEHNDILAGGAGQDVLMGGAGDDDLWGDGSWQAANTDWSNTRTGALTTLVTSYDHVTGGGLSTGVNGADILFGGAGDDLLRGGEGDDLLFGEADSDVLQGGHGNDFLDGGSGDDLLVGDYKEGIGFNDAANAGDEILDGGADSDHLYGDFNGITSLRDGNDFLNGGAGNDFLYGGAGADHLVGGADNDRLVGGTGNDILEGGSGSDVYVINAGDGHDTIIDVSAPGSSDIDRIEFAGSTDLSDVYLSHANNDLTIGFNDGSSSITMSGFFLSPEHQIEQVQFAYGVELSAAQMIEQLAGAPEGVRVTPGATAENDVLIGDRYSNYIFGGEGDDLIIGMGGGDFLYAWGETNSTYIYNIGDGRDTIFDYGGVDTLQFGAGIRPEDVYIPYTHEYSYDVVVGLRGQGIGGGIIFERHEWGYQINRIEQIAFEDGTIWHFSEFSGMMEVAPGSIYDDIVGSASDDIIDGLQGDDSIDADDGNDILIGGAGNDGLDGGNGDDTYIFNLGDGADTIWEDQDGGYDTLQFGPGIGFSDVTFSGDYWLTITINGTADQIVIYDWYGDGYIEEFTFADGVVLSTSQVNILAAGGSVSLDEKPPEVTNTIADQSVPFSESYLYALPDDLFADVNGDETLAISATLDDGSVLPAWLSFDPTTQTFTGTPLTATAGAINISITAEDPTGFQASTSFQMTFPDYVEVIGTDQADTITTTSGNTTVYAGGGDDTINAGSGNTVINAGDGNDRITMGSSGGASGSGGSNVHASGGLGNDTYVIGNDPGTYTIRDVGGANDVVTFSEYDSNASYSFGLGSLLITTPDGNEIHLEDFDPDDVYGSAAIETFIFSDGVELSFAEFISQGFDITGSVDNDVLSGTNIIDRIDGLAGDDMISAGAGDDTLTGGLGNDRLMGGSGNDRYLFNIGDGHDTIEDSTQSGDINVIRFGSGISQSDLTITQDNSVLTIQVGVGSDVISLVNANAATGDASQVIETLEFSDGSQVALASLLITGVPGDNITGTTWS